MATATATPARLQGKIGVDDDFENPIGYIVWFSVPDEDIRLSRLKREWLIAGLDGSVLPRDQKAVNAFKRAVRSLEGIVRNEQDRTVTQTDVREITENAEEVHYQVVRVVKDLKGMRVDYPKAVRIWFVKSDETVKDKPLGEVDFTDYTELMNSFHAAYDGASKTVTGAKVRTLVRQYLRNDRDEQTNTVGLSAENLRGKAGGVYFVLYKHVEELERLAEALWKLYKPEGRAYLHMVPLADTATQRELIRRHHVENSLEEGRAVIGDVAELLRESKDVLGRPVELEEDQKERKRGVRENVVKFQARRLDKAQRRAEEYAAALGEEQDEINHMLGLMRKQLTKLVRI